MAGIRISNTTETGISVGISNWNYGLSGNNWKINYGLFLMALLRKIRNSQIIVAKSGTCTATAESRYLVFQ